MLDLNALQPYIPHIAIMYMMGMQEAESFYCTVRRLPDAHISDSDRIDSLQGKIRRTHSWYVDEFKYTKSLVAPEVSTSRSLTNFMLRMGVPGCQEHQGHHVLSVVVPPASRIGPDLRSVRVQE